MSVVLALVFYFQGSRRFNNLVIFRQSFLHLLEHKNLFKAYPLEYYDIFLYHPTFCLLFSPFSVIPVLPSLLMWTIFGALILFYAIKLLPISHSEKVFFWWFVFIELANTLHSQQTNSVIAALGLFTYIFLEKGKPKWAAIFPIIAFCIKGYGLIFAAIFIFYPKPWKYILYSILWLILFLVLPLPVTGTPYFLQVYKDWFASLTDDHAVNFGYSIMGMAQLFDTSLTDNGVTNIQLIGLFLFVTTWLLKLARGNGFSKNQKLLFLAYSCIWVVVFNHTSEPPTFIIAAQGVALFYLVNKNRGTLWPQAIAIAFIFLNIVAHKDIYPPSWPFGFIPSLIAKTLPCVIVFIILQFQLLLNTKKHQDYVLE